MKFIYLTLLLFLAGCTTLELELDPYSIYYIERNGELLETVITGRAAEVIVLDFWGVKNRYVRKD